MRGLILGLLLSACTASPEQMVSGGAILGLGSIAIMHRTPLDAVYSLVSGRDCSLVHLDRGQSYCRAIEPAPAPPPFCTRGLGTVTCWQDETALPGHPTGVADGPNGLTPAQDADRTKGWLF